MPTPVARRCCLLGLLLIGCGEAPPPRSPPPSAEFRDPIALSPSGRDADWPSLAVDAAGYPWVAFLDFAEGRTSVRVTCLTDRGPIEPILVSEEREEDVTSPRLAVVDSGLLVVWCGFDGDRSQLRFARVDPATGARGEVERIEGDEEILPALCSSEDGGAWLATVWKHDGRQRLRVRRYEDGEFGPAVDTGDPEWNAWDPEVVAEPGGVVVAYDRSAPDRSTDVVVRRVRQGVATPPIQVAASELFEAHPSLARSSSGQLVIAYDQGDPHWGVGGSRFTTKASLHLRRAVGLRVLDGDRLLQPARPLSSRLPVENRVVHEYPRIAFDGAGRLFAVMRSLPTENPLPKNESSVWRGLVVGPGGASRLRYSAGRNDVRPSLASASGRVLAAWTADLRNVDRVDEQSWFRPVVPDGACRVFVDDVKRLVGGGADLLADLVPAVASEPAAPLVDIDDLEARAPWMPDDWKLPSQDRDPPPADTYEPFVIDHEGRALHAWFGDLHRHSDISRCWMNKDGSLEDGYRYALDAARLDFVAITNHPAHMTSWDRRRQEMSVDTFHLPGSLVTFFGYEHVEPYGHKNVVFPSRRGRMVSYHLSGRNGRDDAIAADPGEFLEKLGGSGGLAIPHTPAGQGRGDPNGTDWSYHDPETQRLVEIFQGYRGSYESKDAPRVFPIPSNPEGFVDQALARGYELGFIASSDHHSTLGGYAGVFAVAKTRDAIFDALRRRHTFAATDRIALLVTTESGAMMGDEIKPEAQLSLRVRARAAGDVARLVVIHDGRQAEVRPVSGRDVDERVALDLTGDDASYVYVRLEQANGELAWSSPIFIRP